MIFIPILVFTIFGMGHHWFSIEASSDFRIDIGLMLLVVILPIYLVVDSTIGVSILTIESKFRFAVLWLLDFYMGCHHIYMLRTTLCSLVITLISCFAYIFLHGSHSSWDMVFLKVIFANWFCRKSPCSYDKHFVNICGSVLFHVWSLELIWLQGARCERMEQVHR